MAQGAQSLGSDDAGIGAEEPAWGRLSVMMFLELFIWGAWLPLIFGYIAGLGFTTTQQSWIVNAFALAAFVGMFFSNQFADRNFSAEKDPRDYGRVRLWGKIGWIAAAWPFVFVLVDWSLVPAFGSVSFTQWLGKALGSPKVGHSAQEAAHYIFLVAGIASLALAAFSLVLPHTPPKPAVERREQFAWLEAMRLLKVPFVLVLFIVTFFDACVHQCYFNWAPRSGLHFYTLDKSKATVQICKMLNYKHAV
jgi:MFS family permease